MLAFVSACAPTSAEGQNWPSTIEVAATTRTQVIEGTKVITAECDYVATDFAKFDDQAYVYLRLIGPNNSEHFTPGYKVEGNAATARIAVSDPEQCKQLKVGGLEVLLVNKIVRYSCDEEKQDLYKCYRVVDTQRNAKRGTPERF